MSLQAFPEVIAAFAMAKALNRQNNNNNRQEGVAMLHKSAIIEDYLLKSIESGEFKVGDRLPSQNMLTRHFGCSRTTVLHALENMRRSGFISGVRGSGMFVQSRSKTCGIQEILFIGENVTNLKQNPFLAFIVTMDTGGLPIRFISVQTALERNETLFHPGQAVIWGTPHPKLLMFMEHLRRRGLPQLLINREYGDLDAICTDPDESMREGVSWLMIEGGRDLALVSQSPSHSMPYIQERLLAFYENCFRLHANLRPDLIIKSDLTDFLPDAEAIGRTLFDRPSIPKSIFVMPPRLAMPLLMCATRYGKKAGRDFHMLVFDDIADLEGQPGIAFLRQPMHLFRHETENWIRLVTAGHTEQFRKRLKCELLTSA